jgi:2-dehydrotetronate isomerase
MPKLAANVSWLFTERPFLQRFSTAAEAGFGGAEFLFPYENEPSEIQRALEQAGLALALFNAPPGDFAVGERGLAAIPGREQEFRESLRKAFDYVDALQVPSLHVMSGIVETSDRSLAKTVLRTNLEYALEQIGPRSLTLTLEPINSRDIPGYFLTSLEQAAALVAEIGHPRLKVQLDFYHIQIMGGDVARRTEAFWDIIGHIQIAGVPGRNEPDQGELDYRYLFDRVDALGYKGWIGCEYKPLTETRAGLDWAKPWLGEKKG